MCASTSRSVSASAAVPSELTKESERALSFVPRSMPVRVILLAFLSLPSILRSFATDSTSRIVGEVSGAAKVYSTPLASSSARQSKASTLPPYTTAWEGRAPSPRDPRWAASEAAGTTGKSPSWGENPAT